MEEVSDDGHAMFTTTGSVPIPPSTTTALAGSCSTTARPRWRTGRRPRCVRSFPSPSTPSTWNPPWRSQRWSLCPTATAPCEPTGCSPLQGHASGSSRWSYPAATVLTCRARRSSHRSSPGGSAELLLERSVAIAGRGIESQATCAGTASFVWWSLDSRSGMGSCNGLTSAGWESVPRRRRIRPGPSRSAPRRSRAGLGREATQRPPTSTHVARTRSTSVAVGPCCSWDGGNRHRPKRDGASGLAGSARSPSCGHR